MGNGDCLVARSQGCLVGVSGLPGKTLLSYEKRRYKYIELNQNEKGDRAIWQATIELLDCFRTNK
jgi:hypothetical protein